MIKKLRNGMYIDTERITGISEVKEYRLERSFEIYCQLHQEPIVVALYDRPEVEIYKLRDDLVKTWGLFYDSKKYYVKSVVKS